MPHPATDAFLQHVDISVFASVQKGTLPNATFTTKHACPPCGPYPSWHGLFPTPNGPLHALFKGTRVWSFCSFSPGGIMAKRHPSSEFWPSSSAPFAALWGRVTLVVTVFDSKRRHDSSLP
jgi:hypothetical protein